MAQKKLKDFDPIPMPSDDYQPKHVCLNVRGTNGSGKSYLMTQFLKPDAKEIIVQGWPVQDCGEYYIIGRYHNACGGLDGVRDFYAIAPIVLELIEEKHVLMEGLLWSGIFGASYDLNKKLIDMGHQMVWLMLDTDSRTCVENVLKRRIASLDDRPLNTSALIAKYRSCYRISRAAIRCCYASYIGDVEYLKGVMEAFLADNDPGLRDPFTAIPEFDETIPETVDWHVEQVRATKAQQAEESSLFNLFG